MHTFMTETGPSQCAIEQQACKGSSLEPTPFETSGHITWKAKADNIQPSMQQHIAEGNSFDEAHASSTRCTEHARQMPEPKECDSNSPSLLSARVHSKHCLPHEERGPPVQDPNLSLPGVSALTRAARDPLQMHTAASAADHTVPSPTGYVAAAASAFRRITAIARLPAAHEL